MPKKKAIAAVLLACTLTVSGCAGEELAALDDYQHFGTQTRWVYVPARTEDAQAVWEDLIARADAIEQDVSAEIASSSVARFNAAQPGERVAIGDDAYAALTAAKRVYEETDGAYNPATGLLVDLWGFSPRHRRADYAPAQPYDRADFMNELPGRAYLDAFFSPALLDFGAVELGEDEGGCYAVKPADAFVTVETAAGERVTYTMQLNLSGIGKGYCADEAEDILRAAGVEYGYYTLGASSVLMFADPSEKDGVWEVGVGAPRVFSERANYASIRVRDCTFSTSGDYEQYYVLDGVRYCHIIDPDTGYPVGAAPGQEGSHIVCATIAGGNAAEGDARATALCCMTLEEALAYCRTHALEFRVLFVWYDGTADEYVVYSNLEDWSLEETSLRVEEIA